MKTRHCSWIPVYKRKFISGRYRRTKFQMFVLRYPRLFPRILRQWANYRYIRIGERMVYDGELRMPEPKKILCI